MSDLPPRVRVREVGPRDGFRNEPDPIPNADKVRLIDALARTGLKRIEATSFARRDLIPQWSDAAAVLHAIDAPDGVVLSVLAPDERGLVDALEHRDALHEVHCQATIAASGNPVDACPPSKQARNDHSRALPLRA
jgi:hydroxymethylglutaryl-CoA lyase